MRTPEQYAEKAKNERNKRRIERANRAKLNPDASIGTDGRVIVKKLVSVTCQRAGCNVAFTCVMTTRPVRYCDGCKVIITEEKRVRRNVAEARRKTRRRSEPPKPRRPLIRYAGYDRNEHHESETREEGGYEDIRVYATG